MADYILRGSKRILDYRDTLNVAVTREQIAASIGENVLNFAGTGRDGTSWTSRRYNEAQGQALAGLLGETVANVTTNGGQEIVG